MDYWREAVRIVKAGRDTANPDVRRCERFDGAEIMWDSRSGRLVIVNPDGTIATMIAPDATKEAYPGEYYDTECRRTS